MHFSQNLKKIRSQRNLSLAALSQLCNVSASMLCKIEHGEKVPTIRVAKMIADALSIPLAVFLEESTAAETMIVIRQHERRIIADTHSPVEGQLLSPYPQSGLCIMYVTLPGSTSTGLLFPLSLSSRYNLIVDAGIIELSLPNYDSVQAHNGDAIYFKPELGYEIANPSAETSSYYLIANHNLAD